MEPARVSNEKVIDQTRAAINALARVIYAINRGDNDEAMLGFQRAHELLKAAAKSLCGIELTP